ncbi:MAG TPA: head-tail connector protein [Alphaproteobacteria bacterium]|nr:head-tail connector protein [Alphaproteobacteria bacterium]
MGSDQDVRWSLSRVTAPEIQPVTSAEAKTHLEVDDSDWDTLISNAIKAATQHLDGASGWLGRAIVQQTWDLKLDAFPARITIPLPPLRSITSITYTDPDGDEQTLASSKYQVVGQGGAQQGSIVPAYNESWPETRSIPEAVTVRFVAGYEPTSDSPPDYRANVPQPIKQAILLMVADMYAHRETAIVGAAATTVPVSSTVAALLSPYIVPKWG